MVQRVNKSNGAKCWELGGGLGLIHGRSGRSLDLPNRPSKVHLSCRYASSWSSLEFDAYIGMKATSMEVAQGCPGLSSFGLS